MAIDKKQKKNRTIGRLALITKSMPAGEQRAKDTHQFDKHKIFFVSASLGTISMLTPQLMAIRRD